MVLRILSLAGRKAQDIDYIMPLSVHDCTESAVTFFDMFVNDSAYAAGFRRMVANNFGWKKHVCFIICDGAATGHIMGTSGHGGTCGCNRASLSPPAHRYVLL